MNTNLYMNKYFQCCRRISFIYKYSGHFWCFQVRNLRFWRGFCFHWKKKNCQKLRKWWKNIFFLLSITDYANRGKKKFGDKCESTTECGFPDSICDSKKRSCQCMEHLAVTNHIDKCGKGESNNLSIIIIIISSSSWTVGTGSCALLLHFVVRSCDVD